MRHTNTAVVYNVIITHTGTTVAGRESFGDILRRVISRAENCSKTTVKKQRKKRSHSPFGFIQQRYNAQARLQKKIRNLPPPGIHPRNTSYVRKASMYKQGWLELRKEEMSCKGSHSRQQHFWAFLSPH